ncbi:MAG: ribbon-helix-helix domain-containing protein [Paracoccaceae bacterium]|jgi:predicted DNA-binding ribbon-helix-helix protein|nr:ribbon-helix-helix domain-containing protein [Paracoccaceae bacterium]MDB4230081.1 ribbon-helix-helix domain-containing protein [Paracoccaceae bacterium]MDE2692827.1 ribbon-helix-helix domain-containing protein [Paracoccaceae bacterium]
MYQRPKKRSVLINGHRTSLSLEDSFWIQFCNIAHKNNISINKLITKIDLDRAQKCSLAGAIRLYVLYEVFI